MRPGLRNNTVPNDRVFGAPSIRTDIPAPKQKSVADNSNYGNELDAAALIYVAPYADRGVTDEDYLRPYSHGDLKDLFGAAGILLPDAVFDRVFEEASAIDAFPGERSKACVSTARRVQAALQAAAMGQQ